MDGDPADTRSVRAHINASIRLTAIAFAVVVAALLLLLGTNRYRFEPRLRDSIEAARLVRFMHESMLDQETSLRGFLLTGDSEFLEPYERGRAQLRTLTPQVEELLAGRSDVGPMLVDLRLRQQAWLDQWVPRALEAGRDHEADLALSELLRDGRDLFDLYRISYGELSTELIAERDRRVDEQSNVLVVTALLAVAVAVATALAVLRRGRRLQAAIEAPLELMLQRLERFRGGDLQSGEPITGPEELQRIDAGLRDAADALARSRDHEEEQSTRIFAQNRQLAQVLRLAREVAGSLNLRYVLAGVATSAQAIAERRVVVWLRSDDGGSVEPQADTSAPALEPIEVTPIGLGDGVVGRAARFGRVEGHQSTTLEGPSDATDAIAVPMVVGAEVIGVLQILGDGAPTLPVDTLHVLEALAVQAASAIGAARLHEYTEALALTDPLTRLPNRRQLDRDLSTEVSVSARYGRPLGLGMIDVDHFKDYNDSLGHQAGDVALQQLASLLREVLRTGDTLYRYGGEELCLVMREGSSDDAAALVERLRASVQHAFSSPDQPRAVTISAGVASLPEHGRTADELIAAADAALYEAKRTGRNRVVVAAPVTGQLSGH